MPTKSKSKSVQIRNDAYRVIGLLAEKLHRKQIDIVDLAVFHLAQRFNLKELSEMEDFQAKIQEAQLFSRALKLEKSIVMEIVDSVPNLFDRLPKEIQELAIQNYATKTGLSVEEVKRQLE